MSKDSAGIDVGYPIFGARFINNKAVLVTGGGGEGNHGLPNKITVIKCLFKVSDKSRRLQKFREIVLPDNEDSPMCVDISGSTDDGHLVFIGCNQSEELAKSMNINHNLRKYVYTLEEHLRFQDAAQLEEEISLDEVGEYPKAVCVSSDGSLGCLMTSKTPSSISIFNPDTLDLIFKFTPSSDVEIKDFQLSPNNGKSLCYVTGSSVEVINPASGSLVSSSSKSPAVTKTLSKYILSKVKYINASTVVIVAALRNGKGVALIQYSTANQTIDKIKEIKSKMRCVAFDISVTQDLLAFAGNDCSLNIFRLSDFKILKTYKNYHKFAITCLSFCPNGSKLASGSSDANVKVLKLRPNYAKGRSVIGSLFNYLIKNKHVANTGIFLQKAHETGQLQDYLALASKNSEVYLQQGREYGLVAWDQAQVYGKIGLSHLKHYGELGYSIVQEKINLNTEREATTDDTTIATSEVPAVENSISATSESNSDAKQSLAPVQPPDDSSKAASTAHMSHTLEDIVSQVTKNVADITGKEDFDSSSFFSDTTNYVTTEILSTVLAPVTSSIEVVPEMDEIKEEVIYGTNSTLSDISSESTPTVSTSTISTPTVASEDSEASVEDDDEKTEGDENTDSEDGNDEEAETEGAEAEDGDESEETEAEEGEESEEDDQEEAISETESLTTAAESITQGTTAATTISPSDTEASSEEAKDLDDDRYSLGLETEEYEETEEEEQSQYSGEEESLSEYSTVSSPEPVLSQASTIIEEVIISEISASTIVEESVSAPTEETSTEEPANETSTRDLSNENDTSQPSQQATDDESNTIAVPNDETPSPSIAEETYTSIELPTFDYESKKTAEATSELTAEEIPEQTSELTAEEITEQTSELTAEEIPEHTADSIVAAVAESTANGLEESETEAITLLEDVPSAQPAVTPSAAPIVEESANDGLTNSTTPIPDAASSESSTSTVKPTTKRSKKKRSKKKSGSKSSSGQPSKAVVHDEL